MADSRPSAIAIASKIQELVSARGPDKTICPSEVARALSTDWRQDMAAVRAVAFDLAKQGHLTVTQRGRVIPSTEFAQIRGPIRLTLPRKDRPQDIQMNSFRKA